MIEELRKDVGMLISAFERSQAENRRLSEELLECKAENKACKEQIVELERKIDNFRLKEAFRSSQDDVQAKVRIDGILREIDRCISLLEG